MPSTLLGTRQMRDFGTGIVDRADDDIPLYWKNNNNRKFRLIMQ